MNLTRADRGAVGPSSKTRHPGSGNGMLRIAVVARHLDPAQTDLRSRALWPLAVWRAAGHKADLLHAPVTTTRRGTMPFCSLIRVLWRSWRSPRKRTTAVSPCW